MTIPQTPVFDGISAEECRRIYECFGVQERCFKPEELIYDFDSGRRTIGVLATGSAIVERVDQRGDRTILEHLQPGGNTDITSNAKTTEPVNQRTNRVPRLVLSALRP